MVTFGKKQAVGPRDAEEAGALAKEDLPGPPSSGGLAARETGQGGAAGGGGRLFRSAALKVLVLIAPYCLGIATERYIVSRKLVGGVLPTRASAPAPASYGFVYTAEGMSIADDLISTTASSAGPHAALVRAEGLLKSSRHFLDACHPVMHRFGRAVYTSGGPSGLVEALRQLVPFTDEARKEAASLAQPQAPPANGTSSAMAPVGEREVELLMTCNAAYLHGIIERFLFVAGMSGNLLAGVAFIERTVCARLRGPFRHAWECRHGVGHGISQFHRHMATQRALKAALDMSDAALPSVRGDLWNGIWMDHFASTTVSGHDVDDPPAVLSVCHDAQLGLNRARGDCEMYAPTAFLLHRPREYAAASQWCCGGCAAMGDSCERSCLMGVGMQTFKENLDDMLLVGRVCSQAKTTSLAASCIQGAKSYYSFATGTKVPAELCQQIEAAELRQSCLS